MNKNIITPLFITIVLLVTYFLSIVYEKSFLAAEESLKTWMIVGGAPIVLMLSVAENTIIINTIVPGAVVILTAMSLTSGNPILAFQIYLAIIIGAYLGQILSFFSGKNTKKSFNAITQNEPTMKEFFLTFWHPQLGSITSLKAGESSMSFSTYIWKLSFSAIPWSIFWGFIMYYFGKHLSISEQMIPLALVYSVIWLILVIIKK